MQRTDSSLFHTFIFLSSRTRPARPRCCYTFVRPEAHLPPTKFLHQNFPQGATTTMLAELRAAVSSSEWRNLALNNARISLAASKRLLFMAVNNILVCVIVVSSTCLRGHNHPQRPACPPCYRSSLCGAAWAARH